MSTWVAGMGLNAKEFGCRGHACLAKFIEQADVGTASELGHNLGPHQQKKPFRREGLFVESGNLLVAGFEWR